MPRKSGLVRVSSKGRIVIPAAFRRRLGIKKGRLLTVRAGAQDEIILRPIESDFRAVDEMLRKFHAAARKDGRDPLKEFHERRQREREIEARKRERWSH